MITVPVKTKFDGEEVIGQLTIDETKLPKAPDFHFALGFNYDYDTGEYVLEAIGLTADSKFVSWETLNARMRSRA